MSNRIIIISVNDIIVDPEGQSLMITDACKREISMDVAGVCQIGDNIIVVLEESPGKNNFEYVIAPFASCNIDEIITEIRSRYFSGFSLVGSFDIKLEKWALFKRQDGER